MKDLTQEQLDQLWRQFEHYYPELVKKSDAYVDPEFDQFERDTLTEAEGVLFDEVEVVPFQPEKSGVILPDGVELVREEVERTTLDEWVDV